MLKQTKEFEFGSLYCFANNIFSRTVLLCKLMILFLSYILKGMDTQNNLGCTFNTDPVQCYVSSGKTGLAASVGVSDEPVFPRSVYFLVLDVLVN